MFFAASDFSVISEISVKWSDLFLICFIVCPFLDVPLSYPPPFP